MDFLKKNFIFILASLVIVFIITSYLYIILITKEPSPSPEPVIYQSPQPSRQPSLGSTPQPTSVPNIPAQGKSYQDSVIKIREREADFLKKSAAVANLITKLPYSGANFSLTYDYSTNQFTAILRNSQEDAGNKELDAFLQTNQIDNRTWLNNLIIQTQ